MTQHGKTPPPPAPAPARPRASIDDPRGRGPNESDTTRAGTAASGDANAKELPGGVDPREPQYPGKYSTSENVTTDEQKAAQQTMKKEDITDADVGPYATASRAEQIESQVAAAENPLAPASTTVSEPHTMPGGGLDNPPAPEGFRSNVPQGNAPQGQWKFDPMTGKPLGERSTTESRRRQRLQDDEDDEVEVTLAGPVTLTDDRGGTHRYEAGKQKMPRSHAEHWYIRQHEAQPEESKKSKK